MLLTGCSSNDNPTNKDLSSIEDNTQSNEQITENQTVTETNEYNIWDFMPEIPITDEGAFQYYYDSDLGGMVITDYLKESPKVRIPNTLEGEPVVGVNLSECKKQLTQLVMPDSVVKMSLSGTTEKSLMYLGLPAGVTDYNVRVKYYPDGYEKITADEYYEEFIENAYWNFTAFENLISIGFSAKCPRLTTVGGMLFYDYNGRKILLVCPQNKSDTITIPSGTTEIGYKAFYKCGKITSITIPDSVNVINDYAFNDCISLISITIPNSVNAIGDYAFSDCTSLTSVTIPDNVNKFENNIFNGCKNINVTYKGKTYNYAHIGELYDLVMYGNTGMEGGMLIENNTLVKVSENAVTIEIPDTVTEIAENAFNNCKSLTITFKNVYYQYDNLKDDLYSIRGGSIDGRIHYLYADIHGEEGLTIEDGVLKKVSSELTEVKIPDRVTSFANVIFEPSAFSGCEKLNKITFGKGITEIRGYNFAKTNLSVFYNGCPNITEIIISEGVTSLEYNAFYGCDALKNVTLPNSLKKIDCNAFGYCTSLTNITIPDSVTEIFIHREMDDPIVGRIVEGGAFEGCENIKATYKGKTYYYAHIDDLYKAINGN